MPETEIQIQIILELKSVISRFTDRWISTATLSINIYASPFLFKSNKIELLNYF